MGWPKNGDLKLREATLFQEIVHIFLLPRTAAQTAVLTAETLGLGFCDIGDIFEHYEERRCCSTCPSMHSRRPSDDRLYEGRVFFEE